MAEREPHQLATSETGRTGTGVRYPRSAPGAATRPGDAQPLASDQGDLEAARASFGAFEPSLSREFAQRLRVLERSQRIARELTGLLMEAFSRTGDLDVFGLLYQRSHRDVLRDVVFTVRQQDVALDSHDILQDVFVRLFRERGNFSNAHPGAYRGLTTRLIQQSISQRSRTIDAEKLRVTRAYRAAWNGSLTRDERAALRFVEVERRSYQDVALCAGTSRESIHATVRTARLKLCQAMRDRR